MATRRYKRDFKELELRRRRGMRMLARGVVQAEVARSCGVSRQTASSWARKLSEDPQAWRRKPLGRPGAMAAAQRKKLSKLLVAGALASGFPTELWTLARIGKLIEREFGHTFSTVHVWRVIRELGFSSQRPTGRAVQRDEEAILAWKTKRWPALKKKSRREERTIVFVDESGLSERPTRVKTWAKKGCTPILQYSFRWNQLSLVAGVSFWRFYFRFFHGAVRGPQLVEYLKALKAQIKGKLMIIWDGLPAHRSRVVSKYVESLDGHIVLERLPGYAPELNPVEYLFGYAKQRELANLCLDTIHEVKRYATRRLKSMQRRPTLIKAFWKQAELPFNSHVLT